MEAPIAYSNKNENEIKAFVEGKGEDLYEIDFLKRNDKIFIKSHNTNSESEIFYSYKLTTEEIKKTTSCYSTTHFITQIKQFIDSLKIEKKGNSFLLHMQLDKNKKEIKTVKLEEGSEEEELERDINNLEDAIKVIKILVKENEILKNKLNFLTNEFMEYKNKMGLNFTYNSLDINTYKLDNIYKTLSCRDIIQNRDEFGLINNGFQHIFKKNIIDFECIFKSINNEYNYQEFSNIFNECKYLVIVILTKDNRRFGAFYENCNNNNNNQINEINNNYQVVNQNYNNVIPQIKQGIFEVRLSGRKGYRKRVGYNFQRNNNVLMNQNYNYSINSLNETIFKSSSLVNDYFVFSLNELNIYYCNNQENRNSVQFSIFYDTNRQCLFGQEISNNNLFKLSGKQEFNIKEFELYNVIIGKL